MPGAYARHVHCVAVHAVLPAIAKSPTDGVGSFCVLARSGCAHPVFFLTLQPKACPPRARARPLRCLSGNEGKADALPRVRHLALVK